MGEDDRDLGESEDEADKPITHVEAPSRRRRSSCTPPSALYSWKEVTLGNRLVIEFYFAIKNFSVKGFILLEIAFFLFFFRMNFPLLKKCHR